MLVATHLATVAREEPLGTVLVHTPSARVELPWTWRRDNELSW